MHTTPASPPARAKRLASIAAPALAVLIATTASAQVTSPTVGSPTFGTPTFGTPGARSYARADGPAPGFHYELQSKRLNLYRLNGEVGASWRVPIAGWEFGELAKPLPSGHVLTYVHDPATSGLNKQKKLVELDRSGSIVWEYDPSPLGHVLHHDFQRLPNGNTLVMWREVRNIPQISPLNIADEPVAEVSPSGQIVWSWSPADNRNQLPITTEGWTYLTTRSAVAPLTIFHANSVQALPPNKWAATYNRFSPGHVMISFRDLNLVVIINPATDQVVWSIKDLTLGQHQVKMIPEDMVGAGNLLIFDNGGSVGAPLMPFRGFSRVIELDPLNRTIDWQYECNPAARPPYCRVGEFYAPFRSGAIRLVNGNTLITNGQSGEVFEVARNNRTIWRWQQVGWVYQSSRWPLQWLNPTMPNWSW